jgi:hypothetical protein
MGAQTTTVAASRQRKNTVGLALRLVAAFQLACRNAEKRTRERVRRDTRGGSIPLR